MKKQLKQMKTKSQLLKEANDLKQKLIQVEKQIALTEVKRMQHLAGILKENMNMKNQYSGTIDIGDIKNVYYDLSGPSEIYLYAAENDTIKDMINSFGISGDEFTDEEIDIIDKKIEEVAQYISQFLTQLGVDNEIYDNQLGYGQDLLNLVVAINKDDISLI